MWGTMTEAPIDALALLAERPQAEPFYLAPHRARFGLTESEQRRHLHVPVEDGPAFQLRHMPEADENLQALAGRFRADPEPLGRVLRAGE